MSNPAEPTTAYTPKPFRTIKVEVSADQVKRYLKSSGIIDDFLDFMLQAAPYTLDNFIDEHNDAFIDWTLFDMAGGVE